MRRTEPPANTILEECGSTNDLARELGSAGYPHGTWISARRQTGGRGRIGRSWKSLEGNLFLSILFRSESTRDWTWVPLAAALGAARGLRELAPGLALGIKWPNDLWLDGAKIGGILCESVSGRENAFVVAGIGLNCERVPEGLEQPTAALGLPVELVRPRVIEGMLRVFEELSTRGPEPLRAIYDAWTVLPEGSEIEWGTDAGKNRARVRGLGSSGELLVVDSKGELQRLFAEDVRAVRKASDGSLP
ncbi:MAG: biotin--[acetyl-CoA-carboxylase] ligase [Oligoflexia bacterium]|nr:biotin--[acetyl-CoA-carboxylase] ligase [Oligoflexia bacterium]